MKNEESTQSRRQPRQERSRQTVEAVLDAVPRVLKRHGAGAVTTNRIAEVAGVSIGSLYQYFPDKQAIFNALHERHVEMISAAVPASSLGFKEALQIAFERVLPSPEVGTSRPHAGDRLLFVLPHLVEALVHAVPQARPPFTVDRAKGEVIRTVLHYLDRP